MKHSLLPLLLLVLVLSIVACGGQETGATEATLAVAGGEFEQTYTLEQLRALPATTASNEGTTYVGVSLPVLLQDAGFDLEEITVVTAVAADEFSATYERDLFATPDTIVAYGTEEGNLAQDEQPLRMVLPEQPGRMNVRMLARIEVSS